MRYFELNCTLYLKEELYYLHLHERLSKFINEAFNDKDKLSKFHFKNGYKHYCFDLLYNPHLKIKNGIYPKENSYRFRLRSLERNLLENLQNRFVEVKNPTFVYISSAIKEIKKFFVQNLTSVTPVIVSVDVENTKQPRHWTIKEDGDILRLSRQLHENLLKKYESFYKEKLNPSQNFIQLIEITNRVPQTIRIDKNNKEIKFFGNKFKIIPNEDDISQKLAFLALSCGLGEKQSYGGGFCIGKGLNL